MTRLSHTQRRDNSLRGSLQGLALSVGGVVTGAGEDHDEFDESQMAETGAQITVIVRISWMMPLEV